MWINTCLYKHADGFRLQTLFQGITRLNKFGVTLSPTSKLKLQDECSEVTQSNLVEELRKNPMVKIIGKESGNYNTINHLWVVDNLKSFGQLKDASVIGILKV